MMINYNGSNETAKRKGLQRRSPAWNNQQASQPLPNSVFVSKHTNLTLLNYSTCQAKTNTMPKSSEKSSPKKKGTQAKVVAKKTSTCSAKQLLGVIAELGLFHNGKPPRDLVARRAGYSGGADNQSFKKALSRAAKKGHLDTSDKEVLVLTDSGRKEAGDPPKLETNEDAHARIKADLSPKMVEAFDLLVDGKPHPRSELAKKLGYKSVNEQGFKKLLNRIKAKLYLEFIGDTVQLTEMCFPAGRD